MEATDSRALQAKIDADMLNAFIEEHRGFIISCVSGTTHRFIAESDDEFSIGLMAFHEAIEKYEEGKGSFLSFASLVIKRRLYDEARKIKPEYAVAFDELYDEREPSAVSDRISRMSIEAKDATDETVMVRQEIEEATEALKKYGFTFFDLIDSSPKSKRTRATCTKAIVHLLRPGEIYEKMKSTGRLPVRELSEAAGIPVKKLERHRKYIMAVGELLTGDFPHLQEYLKDIRKELS